MTEQNPHPRDDDRQAPAGDAEATHAVQRRRRRRVFSTSTAQLLKIVTGQLVAYLLHDWLDR